MFVDYPTVGGCKNEASFGMICVKCGQCGREFKNGALVKESDSVISDDKALRLAKELKAYCIERDSCEGCPFEYGDYYCRLEGDNPTEWGPKKKEEE